MRLKPLKRSSRLREVANATVVAEVGWRKVAGRDVYRICVPAGAAGAAPAVEAHRASLAREEYLAKAYRELLRRGHPPVKAGLAQQRAKLSFSPEGGPS